MEDNRINVLDRLAAADPEEKPLRVDPASAERVLAAILAEPRDVRRPRRRRLVAAAVAAVLVGLAAPALAFDGVRSFIGWGHGPVLEEAQLLVSAPVADGTVARLWWSPSTSGGECLFETFGPPGDVERPAEMGAGGCTIGVPPPEGASIIHVGGAGKVHGAEEWVPPVVSGGLDADLGAARVEVRWTGGAKPLAFANDYFIGAVEELYEPAAQALPFFLVAYDADGQEVARRKLYPVRLD
jgi:hypothetical protein